MSAFCLVCIVAVVTPKEIVLLNSELNLVCGIVYGVDLDLDIAVCYVVKYHRACYAESDVFKSRCGISVGCGVVVVVSAYVESGLSAAIGSIPKGHRNCGVSVGCALRTGENDTGCLVASVHITKIGNLHLDGKTIKLYLLCGICACCVFDAGNVIESVITRCYGSSVCTPNGICCTLFCECYCGH